jgi:hypothetical protein
MSKSKGEYAVLDFFNKPIAVFTSKAAADRLARSLRAQSRSSGNYRGSGQYIRVKKMNPARRPSKRKNAAPKSRSLSLRNFTGKVRLNPDKTVSVLGVGKKKAKAKKGKR